MASEASFSTSLSIEKDNLHYRQASNFLADVSAAKGPTPGIVLATESWAQVDLSMLTTPGLCYIANLSEDYTVCIGTRDTASGEYSPTLDFLPGEGYPVRLSQFLGQELESTSGTGTAGSGCTLAVKGIGGSAYLRVEAFEK
jgi:hypothetical protein